MSFDRRGNFRHVWRGNRDAGGRRGNRRLDRHPGATWRSGRLRHGRIHRNGAADFLSLQRGGDERSKTASVQPNELS